MRISRVWLQVLVAAAALAVPSAANAGVDEQATERHRPLPAVINGFGPSLHPEGVAYDPYRQALLVGSVRHGTVSIVEPDGSTRTLVDDPRLVSTLGIHVDPVRRRLLVVNADNGLSVRSSPATTRRLAALGIYDLHSGRPLHYVDLGVVAADGAEHLANDVAIGRDGTAYVTDSFSPLIYQVRSNGRASVLVRDERLRGAPIGINGIVAHPAGFLMVAHSGEPALYRVPLSQPRELSRVQLAQPISRPDGLVLRPDGSLVVVQNPAGGPFRVTSLRPTRRDWTSARTVETLGVPEHVTTAVRTPWGIYVLSGRLNILQTGATDDTFVVRRVAFRSG